MKYIVLSILSFFITSSDAQDFYDLNTVQTIEITFAESNWDALLDAQKAGDENYILAQSISINGEVFDSIGVKYKGNSTYNANQAKNPFHIELDTYKDHKYEAYTDIKLSNVAKDPSFLREVMSYHVLRQYMDAPLSNYANVYINGDLIGLYSNSESISKKFVNSRFGSKSNTFVKCSPPAGAGPQSNDLPNLVYLGDDSLNYIDAYELKSDEGWSELIDLCDTLSNSIGDIEEILDVDRALWMLAFNNVLVNLDSYSGLFAQNYYLYRDDNGRFLPVVWDLNESFGKFPITGGSNNLFSTASKQRMNHLLHENNSDYPLIQQLLSVPIYKRMYLAHIKTMLVENFADDSIQQLGESLQALIDSDVQADNNKLFTYNNFLSNLTSDINGGGGPGGGTTPGIVNLMSGRADYLLGLSDFTQSEPTITDIVISNSEPLVNTTVDITAVVTDAISVFIGYRSGDEGPFTRIEMFDDGVHNDGAANDGVYGTEVLINDALIQYYIYAENDGIGKFSPQRAEFEYHTIAGSIGAVVLGDLVINEFMASNEITVADQDGEFEDWIELYNNGTTSITIDGYTLSDDVNNLAQWSFPLGTVIEPDSYLIIWADNDVDQDGLHASFKLSASGETIYLSDATGSVIDEVTYMEQTTDISSSRIPNGTGDFQSSASTFGSNNDEMIGCDNSGGDADNDGVCADVDCDDSDPDIGAQQAPGASCDDGDAATTNDVIQDDGCTCAGSIVVMTELVINEFMASNEITVADQNGEFDDWIELYNNGTQSIDLEGYTLSDDGADLGLYTFPAGTVIEADGYLIIWADNDVDQDGLHAGFKLSAAGETLFLVDDMGTIIDQTTYAEQVDDISYGRAPNGTGDFRRMPPTFNAINSLLSNTADVDYELSLISVFPNPAQNQISILSTVELSRITILNSTGKKLIEETSNSKSIDINVSDLPSGVYLIEAMTVDQKRIIEKLVIEK